MIDGAYDRIKRHGTTMVPTRFLYVIHTKQKCKNYCGDRAHIRVGKGITAASIGHLISKQVTPIKLDGYLNTDPGTMNPLEHGEVFVLDDGSEVDMDFGHYERFLNTTCTGSQSLTMGKVFEEIRQKERRGDYLGKTVQYVPHVVDLIKEKILSIKSDVVLIEVGGTVGDLENNLYIEAVRQLRQDVGKR